MLEFISGDFCGERLSAVEGRATRRRRRASSTMMGCTGSWREVFGLFAVDGATERDYSFSWPWCGFDEEVTLN